MLTPKQNQILGYIKKYIGNNNYSPSLDEIAKRFRLAKSTVHQHVKTLIKDGYLRKTQGGARAIVINQHEQLVNIPLLGVIAAGKPIEAIENKEIIAVSKNTIPKTGEVYALKVQGDSMTDENIENGDIVLIKNKDLPTTGIKSWR